MLIKGNILRLERRVVLSAVYNAVLPLLEAGHAQLNKKVECDFFWLISESLPFSQKISKCVCGPRRAKFWFHLCLPVDVFQKKVCQLFALNLCASA